MGVKSAGAASGWGRSWAERVGPHRRTILGLAALTLLAYCFRVLGAHSSINYIPDTQIIREALDIGQTFASSRSFEMSLGEGLKYPLTLPYYLLVVYGLVFAAGFVSGWLPTLQAFIDFLFLQRENVHLISIAALNLINAAAIPLAFLAARRLNPNHTGWLAAALAAVDLVLIQFGHQARPHTPLASFSLLAVLLLVGMVDGPRRWRVTLAGTVACGVTIGTLQSGLLIMAPFGAAWSIRLRDAWQRGELGPELRFLTANLLVLTMVCAILYPPIFSEYFQLLQNFFQRTGQYSLGGGAHSFSDANFQLDHYPRFVSRFWGYQPLAALFPAALGCVIWQQRQHWRGLSVFLALPLVSLPIWGAYFTAARYWGELVLFSAILCAYLLEEAVRLIGTRWKRPQPVVLTSMLAVVGLPLALLAARLTYVTGRPDTRTLASQWIEQNLPSGAGIIGNFQLLELTPTAASLSQQQADHPGSLGTYNQWLLQQSAETYPPGPAYNIVDYTFYWPDDEAGQRALVQARRIEYAVVQINLMLGLSPDQRLFEYAQKYGKPTVVYCPGARWEVNYLPTDIFGLAWLEIWKVDHPGPIVVIFQLLESAQDPRTNPDCV